MHQSAGVVHQEHRLLHGHALPRAAGDEGNAKTVTRYVWEDFFEFFVETAIFVAGQFLHREIPFLEDFFQVGRKLWRDRSGKSFSERVGFSLRVGEIDRFLSLAEINIVFCESCLTKATTKS